MFENLLLYALLSLQLAYCLKVVIYFKVMLNIFEFSQVE